MTPAWGNNLFNQTNVPAGLSNVTAIAVGAEHSLAITNGKVVAWGYNGSGQLNVPAGLSNVVAVAAGDEYSMALTSNGIVYAWGSNSAGQTNVPAGLSNVMAIAAGAAHSVALLNTGTVVAWGDNANDQTTIPLQETNIVITTIGAGGTPQFQTNIPPPFVVKLIAAGGNHTMAAIFSPLVQYPVNISQDLLLIYNTNSLDSSNVWRYYINNRPMVANANTLALGCETNEQVSNAEYTTVIAPQIQTWLSNNPTKRPSYVILFPDIPSRPDITFEAPSTQVQINTTCATNWQPFVTSINMNGAGGTNDCIAYINKIKSMASNNPPGTLFIGGTAAHYGNTNWYFDDTIAGVTNSCPPTNSLGYLAEQGVLAANPSASIFYSYNTIITNGTNIAGYYSRGTHNDYFTSSYPTNGQIVFSGASKWYLIETDESFNGQRVPEYPQGNFLGWYASNAFGGSSYSCTPIGAVCHVNYTLGQAAIDIFSPNWNSANPGIIDGNYTVFLQAGQAPGGTATENASLGQDGTIPANMESVQFSAWNFNGNSPLSVSFAGHSLSLVDLYSGRNPSGQVYTVYGANIAPYAGQSGQLEFTAVFPEWIELDDISFSSQAVPEPSPLVLTGIGALVFALYRRFAPKRP